MPKVLSSFPDAEIAQIIDVLAAAGKPAGISRSELEARRPALERELLSLLEATGRTHDGSEGAKVWEEAVGHTPTHAQLGAGYGAMAEAPNPLDPLICRGDLRSGMNRQLRAHLGPRWKKEGRFDKLSLGTIVWDDLSDFEQSEVRELARRLAAFERSLARARRKNDLDTILLGLAEIYLHYTSNPAHWSEISYAENSRFIRFLTLVVGPAAKELSVPAAALTQRWRRLVRDEQASRAKDDIYPDVP